MFLPFNRVTRCRISLPDFPEHISSRSLSIKQSVAKLSLNTKYQVTMTRLCLIGSSKTKMPRPLLIFFLSLLPLLLQCNAISDEGKILLKIKETEWNDTHNALSNWNASDENPCGWNGVFCDYIGFNVVTKVNLSNTSIGGSLTSTICALLNLTELILELNNFRGPFPDGLLACKRLQTLDLSANLFVGSLPRAINQLVELRHLILGSNNFTGDIPPGFGRLHNLETLWLSHNILSGSIPAFLGNLSHLHQLWLKNCTLEGKIPSSLGNLTELESLDLSSNRLSGNMPTSLMRLSKMTELYLWSNELSGQIPHNIDDLRSIRLLDFSSNQLNGTIPEAIANLTHLETLSLFENTISGSVPERIGMLVNLTTLELSSNKLAGWLPQNLGTHSDLWLLDVSENYFRGPLPPNVCKGRNLYALVIFSNNFNGSLQPLESCNSLIYAQLYKNHLSGEVPLALWGSQKLIQLYLYDNMFEGHIPAEIGRAKELKWLEMANNRFSGIIPPEIGQLTNLLNFNANNNRLWGVLPDELAGLRSISSLQLDHNLLSGEIPKGIMSLANLSEINLGNNKLTGEIPPWLGFMSTLIAIDLSNNLLEGGIPPELGNLRLLIFNVSGNQLSGSIPYTLEVGAFNDSFFGNPSLCSDPGFKLRVRSCSSKKRDLHHYLPIILVSILVLTVAIILFPCFKISSRVRNLFLGKPTSSTLTWEATYFHSGLELSESYIVRNLTEENVVGSGGSGKVYKVTLRNGKKVAVKKILKKTKEFEAEVATLGLIRHANIVKLLCWISSADSDFKYLVFEYIQNGSLFECLHRSETMALLEWPIRQKIAVGIARGLFYLHNDCTPPILHRDVKSSNILLDSEFEAKIADFGIAKRILFHRPLEFGGDGLTISDFAGSHGYIAPEYCMGLKVNEKSDVYSFGVVVLELVTGKRATGELEYGESLDIVGWIRSKLLSKEPDEWRVVLQQEEEEGILDWRILQAEEGSDRWRQKMLGMLRLGLVCTTSLPNRRPSMRQVLHMLQSMK